VSLDEPEPDPGDPRRLAREGARTADRLRTLSLVRLAAPTAEGRSRAAAAFALAQELADRAAALAARPRRVLPELPDGAAGDVLAVCVADLVEQLEVPDPAGRSAELCARSVAQLRALRQQL
jgi:hypothetical protein